MGLCMMTYMIVVGSLCYWTYEYGCKKNTKEASWVLVVLLAALFASFSQGNDVSRVLLSPLIAWAIFATLLNTTEAQQESAPPRRHYY
jgi:tryptophan-rich sensory protein